MFLTPSITRTEARQLSREREDLGLDVCSVLSSTLHPHSCIWSLGKSQSESEKWGAVTVGGPAGQRHKGDCSFEKRCR